MHETRIHGKGFREAIGQAFVLLPTFMQQRLSHVRFVTGVDPNFIGLHSYKLNGNPHYCRERHIDGPRSRKVETIVLPRPDVEVIVHELGHAFHTVLNDDTILAPVSNYAKTNKYEAFAEAFAFFFCPTYKNWFTQTGEIDELGLHIFRDEVFRTEINEHPVYR